MKERFRLLIEKNRWLKAVPNSLTLCNSLCGFAAILFTLRVYNSGSGDMRAEVFAMSAWLILFAMVFDSLDGFAARIFNAASMHGIQMDSLADMVTFGVAPATLVAILAHTQRNTVGEEFELTTYLLCSVYLGGAALRLATYNVHAMVEKKSSDKFSGLPSPGAAAAICSVVLWAQHTNFSLSHLTVILPVYAAILGLLMVSKVPYTHFGKWVLSIRRNRNRQFMVLVLVIGLIIFRANGLMALVTIYIFSGPFQALWGAIRTRRTTAEA